MMLFTRATLFAGQQTNFNKLPTDQVTSLGLKYDYDSIMHYARNTYSINVFLDTIQPIGIPQGKKVPEIGQRIGLSAGDIQQTQILYNCPSKLSFIHIVSITVNN